MNINPDKIKELVLIFAELDEEYQKELMRQAYTLSLKQSQKNLILKENKKFKNKVEFEKEIEDRSNKRAEEMMDMIDIFEKAGDNEKAEIMILLNKLSGGNLGKKTNIEIKINEEKVSLKDYLEEILPEADFRVANANIEKLLKEV